jgi:hypothetical protein
VSKLSSSQSIPDLHAAHHDHDPDEQFDESDRISISSTASSASVLLRSLSSGFRKSRRSIIGIFKGHRRVSAADDDDEVENKFPFGVPGEEASVGVSYATAEGEIAEMTEERRKSTIFGDREKKSKKGKKDSPPTTIRGILKCRLPLG